MMPVLQTKNSWLNISRCGINLKGRSNDIKNNDVVEDNTNIIKNVITFDYIDIAM